MNKNFKLINSLSWSFIDLLSRQGLTFVIHIVLARILLPADFGLIGMVSIFIAISMSLVNSGMDQALIREKKLTPQDYSTVFIYNLLVSGIIYLIIFFFAPIIAKFYSTPEITSIIRVLMLILFFNAFSLVPRVILIRNLAFKNQSIISIASNIFSGVVSISLALYGFGVWSLVAQQLTMKFIEMILLLFFYWNKPILSFNVELFKKYFTFGYRLTLSGLINNFYNNIYYVIIGRLFSLDVLGYYTNANKLKDATTLSITGAIQKVTYPILSQQQDNPNKLTRNYVNLIKVTTFILFPTLLGIAAISPSLIPLLLGEKWAPSILFFQLLCVAGIFFPVQALNLNILKVKNRSDLFLKIEIQKKVLLTIFIVLALIFKTGVVGLIVSFILGSITSSVINILYTQKVIEYAFIKQIRDLSWPLFLSIIMFAFVTFIEKILEAPFLITLILQISSGILVYTFLSWLFKLNQLKIVIKEVKRLI